MSGTHRRVYLLAALAGDQRGTRGKSVGMQRCSALREVVTGLACLPVACMRLPQRSSVRAGMGTNLACNRVRAACSTPAASWLTV